MVEAVPAERLFFFVSLLLGQLLILARFRCRLIGIQAHTLDAVAGRATSLLTIILWALQRSLFVHVLSDCKLTLHPHSTIKHRAVLLNTLTCLAEPGKLYSILAEMLQLLKSFEAKATE